MIVLNGRGGDKHNWYAFYTGVLYARGGVLVPPYDTAGEGERNPERRPDFFAADPQEPRQLVEEFFDSAGILHMAVLQAVLTVSKQEMKSDPEQKCPMEEALAYVQVSSPSTWEMGEGPNEGDVPMFT